MKKTDIMFDKLKLLIPYILDAHPDNPINSQNDERGQRIIEFVSEFCPEVENPENIRHEELESYRQSIVSISNESYDYAKIQSQPYNRDVYNALLPYSQFLHRFENNGLAFEHAYKLSVLFDTQKKALDYVQKSAKSLRSQQPLHDACLFALPPKEINLKAWKKLCERYLLQAPFKQMLGQAAELESYIISLSKDKPKPSAEAVKLKAEEIKALNKKIKDAQSRHSELSDEEESELEDNQRILVKMQLELTEMGIPFNENLSDTVLTAFRERFIFDSSQTYRLFLEMGLNKIDYAKFIKLDITVNNDIDIPDKTLDGNQLGYPGYYLRKIPRGDEEYAALGAYLGKLTDCCQSLSGESGEPCTIDGLTSPHSGFYIVCKGDVHAPKATDKIIGQTWAWRSKNEAIVFDSIEKTDDESEEDILDMLTSFYQTLAKQLVIEGKSQSVMCGTGSGISCLIGQADLPHQPEEFKSYSGYTDSSSQMIIYDFNNPHLMCSVDVECKEKTVEHIKAFIQNNQNPFENLTFLEIFNWSNSFSVHNRSTSAQSANLTKNIIDQVFTQQCQNKDILNIYDQARYFFENEKLTTDLLLCIQKYPSLVRLGTRKDSTPLRIAIEEKNTNFLLTCLQSSKAQKWFFDDNPDIITNCLNDSKDSKIIQVLIQHGGHLVKESFDRHGSNAISLAARRNKSELIPSLVECGVDINHVDKKGNTPLLTEIELSNFKSIEALLNAGADINLAGKSGWTPLVSVLVFKELIDRRKLISLIMQNNPSIDTQDPQGRSPLYFALKLVRDFMTKEDKIFYENLITTFIEKGADVNCQSKNEESILDCAIRTDYYNPTILRRILESNISLESVTKRLEKLETAWNFPTTGYDPEENPIRLLRLKQEKLKMILEQGTNPDNSIESLQQDKHSGLIIEDSTKAVLFSKQANMNHTQTIVADSMITAIPSPEQEVDKQDQTNEIRRPPRSGN